MNHFDKTAYITSNCFELQEKVHLTILYPHWPLVFWTASADAVRITHSLPKSTVWKTFNMSQGFSSLAASAQIPTAFAIAGKSAAAALLYHKYRKAFLSTYFPSMSSLGERWEELPKPATWKDTAVIRLPDLNILDPFLQLLSGTFWGITWRRQDLGRNSWRQILLRN